VDASSNDPFVLGFTAFDEITIPTSSRHDIHFVIDCDCRFYPVRLNNQQEVTQDDDAICGDSDWHSHCIPDEVRQFTKGEDVDS
jgi:hypothetical protein